MKANFHLSIGVNSIDDSVSFFSTVMQGKVTHRDPSGYANIDLFGSQITLKLNTGITPNLPDFHFGINLGIDEFNNLAENILKHGREYVVMEPKVVDAETSMERKKMYLKCPTGYLIEIKGYKKHES